MASDRYIRWEDRERALRRRVWTRKDQRSFKRAWRAARGRWC